MDAKPKELPTIDEMYVWLDRQILSAVKCEDSARVDYLLDQRLKLPELRTFLVAMGARG